MTRYDDETLERRIELERSDAARNAILQAVRRLESLDGNELYLKAWKVAIRTVKGTLDG